METMKTFTEKLVNSGVITSGTMLNYLLWQDNLDYDFIETVYRLKPKWLSREGGGYYVENPILHDKLGGRYAEIDSVTPLYVALLREDKTLECLLLHLGADVQDVFMRVYFGDTFVRRGLEEARSFISAIRGASACAVK